MELLRHRQRQARGLCRITYTHVKSPHVEQLSPTDFAVVIDKPTTFEYTCHPRTFQYKTITQNTKITLAPHCEFYINNHSYPYEEPLRTRTTFLLPNITLEEFPLNDIPTISLKELKTTQVQLSHLKKIHTADGPKYSHLEYIWLIIILITIILTLLITYFYKRKQLRKKSQAVYEEPVSFSRMKETVNIPPTTTVGFKKIGTQLPL